MHKVGRLEWSFLVASPVTGGMILVIAGPWSDPSGHPSCSVQGPNIVFRGI